MTGWIGAALQMAALALGMFLFGWGIALSNEQGKQRDGALWLVAGGALLTSGTVVMMT